MSDIHTYYTKRIIRKLKSYQFSTFLIGIISGAKKNNEFEKPFKRLLGMAIEKKLNKKVDFKDPDILIHLALENKKIFYQIKPVYLYGRYQKLVSGIPQTKWRRKRFKTSVEEEIGRVVIKITKGKKHIFHGCGREDIDVITIGQGRPFVIEIKEPKVRVFDLTKTLKMINQSSKIVQVSDLSFTEKEKIKQIKLATPDKVYETQVEIEQKVSKVDLLKACQHLSNTIINQKTPTRVLKRRYDLLRKKKIHYFLLKKFDPVNPIFEIKSESGTYIKELISGDNNRTYPSLSSILNKKSYVKKLVVLEVLY